MSRKFAFTKSDTFNSEELKYMKASYKNVIDTFIGDIVLCNEIVGADEFIYDCMNENAYNDNGSTKDIYSFYLCHIVSEHDKEILESYGIILSYSNLLDCDVLCVDHWGTSWDYVLTDIPILENFEEWKEYMGWQY